MTWSIRARLTVWYSSVMVVVLITAAIAIAAVHERLAYARIDAELEGQIQTLERVMREEFEEGEDLPDAAKAASSEIVARDGTLMVLRPDGSVIEAWGRSLPASWRAPSNQPDPETVTMADAPIRTLSRSLTDRGHQYVAVVAAPLGSVAIERRDLFIALGVAVLIALAVAGTGGWLVARQSLRPLTELASQAAAITERDPSGRLHPPEAEDELSRLARAFNAVLDRLAAALHGQRQFMADAAHELRTPVSVVRTTAQVTLAQDTRPEHDYRESMAIVEEQSTRLKQLVESMFLLSRAEALGIPLVREPLYVDDLITECARALRVLADERQVTLRTCGDSEVTFSGDTTLLKRLIGNLLDNAIRHARTEGHVIAAVARNTGSIAIRISDDGSGIPPEHRDRVFERFARFDGRGQGAGLGLPIARWIAEAHGGTLTLESTGPDGSCFTVLLPAP
jgi:heavy metal sensor kinase